MNGNPRQVGQDVKFTLVSNSCIASHLLIQSKRSEKPNVETMQIMKNIQSLIKSTKLLQIAAMAALFVLTGCASIVSKSNWPVSFKSNPPGAQVVITDNMGNEVDRGTTPVIFTLKSSDGFFSGATYYAEFKLNDYQVSKKGIHADVNGWYFGNIFFGGFIGLLIDPMTGAMWKLQPICSVNLNTVDSPTAKQ